jgi:hypothetical protein
MRRLSTWLFLAGLSIIVGFGLAVAVIAVSNALLPPFRPQDDETMRELGPVLIAYAVWAITSLGGATLAWRFVNRRPPADRTS